MRGKERREKTGDWCRLVVAADGVCCVKLQQLLLMLMQPVFRLEAGEEVNCTTQHTTH
jgi:hypothetical protein